ncbi:hypothetical protein AB6A23_06080 [Paenibacillus tarimensis]
MKNMAVLLLVLLTLVSVTACSSTTQGEPGKDNSSEPKKMLYYKRSEGGNDAFVIKHLETLGFIVVERSDNTLKSKDHLDGFDLVYISDSVNAARITSDVKHSSVPIIFAQKQLAVTAGLTPLFGGNGTVGNTKTIQIKDGSHPLAAGLKGEVAVYKENGSIQYAEPGEEAFVIAVAGDDDRKAVLFGYEKGSNNALDEPVPARQLFFYMPSGQESNMSADGWKLLDAAVHWAVDKK